MFSVILSLVLLCFLLFQGGEVEVPIILINESNTLAQITHISGRKKTPNMHYAAKLTPLINSLKQHIVHTKNCKSNLFNLSIFLALPTWWSCPNDSSLGLFFQWLQETVGHIGNLGTKPEGLFKCQREKKKKMNTWLEQNWLPCSQLGCLRLLMWSLRIARSSALYF